MRKKVLIIEDDQDIRDSIVELLEDEYETSTAANGAEALGLLRSESKFDLILLDLMMPVMDGFTFREEQLKNPDWAKIPVVVMSADGHVVAKQTRASAAAYLKKPVDIEELLAMLKKHAG